MSVYLKEQTLLPKIIAWVYKVKIISCLPWAEGITSRISIMLYWYQLWGCCWVCSGVQVWQACYVGLGVHGFCVVLGWVWLPPVPCSVGWHWNKGFLQASQLHPQLVGLLLGMQMGMAPTGSLGDLMFGQCVGPWVGRTGPGLWLKEPRGTGWKSRAVFISTVKIEVYRTDSRGWIAMSPVLSLSTLDYSLTMARGAKAKYVAIWWSPKVQIWVSPQEFTECS